MSANTANVRKKGESDQAVIRRLKGELDATRHELQTHSEELQSINEELRVSNEDYLTANETMRSLNESLLTVNGKLQQKIQENDATNNDLNNFLTSTCVPILFLDPAFNVRRYSPAMSDLLTLSPADVGHPLAKDAVAALGPDAPADARAVLELLIPISREVSVGDSWFMRTTLPYRTSANRIEGVVVTIVDTTQRRKIEIALRESEANYKELIENASTIILRVDSQGVVTFVNEFSLKFFGYTHDEIIGRNVNLLIPPVESGSGRNLREMTTAILHNPDDFIENINENILKNGERVWISWRNKGIRDSQGNHRGHLAIGLDVTDRKRTEDRVLRNTDELRSSNNELSRFNHAMVDRENRMIDLKKEINELCRELGTPERYEIRS